MQNTLRANGEVIRRLREGLGFSQAYMESRSFETGWPKAKFTERNLRDAENGKRIVRRNLESMAYMLGASLNDISVLDERACPFPGLRPFETSEYLFFGGRDSVVDDVCDRLKHQKVVAVIGASGSGKSSLVNAGVLPRLEDDGPGNSRKLVIRMRPGSNPVRSLAVAIAELNEKGVAKLNPADEIEQRLMKSSSDLAELIRATTVGILNPDQFILFVDQWEELYSQCKDANLRKVFLNTLDNFIAAKMARLLITVRADFLGEVLEEEYAQEIAKEFSRGQIPLKRLTEVELQIAIEKPAQIAKLRFEKGLVTTLLADAKNEPSQLPVLQSALRQMWELRDQNTHTLTLDSYANAIGRLSGAINKHADEVFYALSDDERRIARQVLPRLVATSANKRDVSKRLSLNEFDDDQKALLQKLASEKTWLVTIDNQGNGEEVELGHEALARDWETLKKWLSDNPQFFIWRDELRLRLRKWEASSESVGDILRGSALAEAKDWLLRMRDFLDEAEVRLIDRSIAIAGREADRKKVVMWLSTFAAVAVLIAAIGTALFFRYQNQVLADQSELIRGEQVRARKSAEQAQKSEEIALKARDEAKQALTDSKSAQSRLLAVFSAQQLDSENPNGALVLAAAGLPSSKHPEWPTNEAALNSVVSALAAYRPTQEVLFEGTERLAVADMAVLADGKSALVVVASLDNFTWDPWLVDLRTGEKRLLALEDKEQRREMNSTANRSWKIDPKNDLFHYRATDGHIRSMSISKWMVTETGFAKAKFDEDSGNYSAWIISDDGMGLLVVNDKTVSKYGLQAGQPVLSCVIATDSFENFLFHDESDGFEGVVLTNNQVLLGFSNINGKCYSLTKQIDTAKDPQKFLGTQDQYDHSLIAVDHRFLVQDTNFAEAYAFDFSQKKVSAVPAKLAGESIVDGFPTAGGYAVVVESGKIYLTNSAFEAPKAVLPIRESGYFASLPDRGVNKLVLSYDISDENGTVLEDDKNSIIVDFAKSEQSKFVASTGQAIAYSSNGQYIWSIVGTDSNDAYVYLADTLEPIAKLSGVASDKDIGQDPLVTRTFDASESVFIAVSSNELGRLLVWERNSSSTLPYDLSASSSEVTVGPGELVGINQVNGDNSESDPQSVQLVYDWRARKTYVAHDESFSNYVMDSSLPSQFALSGDRQVWQLNPGVPPVALDRVASKDESQNYVLTATKSLNRAWVVLKGDSQFSVFSGLDGKLIHDYSSTDGSAIIDLKIDDDGNTLVELGAKNDDGDIVKAIAWLSATKKPKATREVSSDEKLLVIEGSSDAVVLSKSKKYAEIWKRGKLSGTVVLPSIADKIKSVFWANGEKDLGFIVSGDDDESTIYWLEKKVSSIGSTFSISGKYLLVQSDKENFELYQVGKLDAPLLHIQNVLNARFSGNGTFLLVDPKTGPAEIYRNSSGELIAQFPRELYDESISDKLSEDASHIFVSDKSALRIIPTLPVASKDIIALVTNQLPRFSTFMPAEDLCNVGSLDFPCGGASQLK